MTARQLADRQGDVSLIQETMKPGTALATYGKFAVPRDDKGRVVLALGEVTGHAHAYHDEGITLLRPPEFPSGHSLLVVSDTKVKKGSFIEGKVLEAMPGGTIRFQQTDGTIIRFAPKDVTVKGDLGVKVNRDYSLLRHEEHDAIPTSKGVFRVVQQETADSGMRRRLVED